MAPNSIFGTSARDVPRPLCPHCQTRMMLARIQPGPPGFDTRSFECPKCETTHKATVALDPVDSRAAGWINSSLKPPE